MRRMTRGKQQILLHYLPGNTFDFERVGTIARVSELRGDTRTDLNISVVLRRVREHARAWHPDLRPTLRNDTLEDATRWILIEPKRAQSQMFPRVLWCQNRACGRVWNCENRDSLPSSCNDCGGDLIQMRHVKIHRCGELKPLEPPASCMQCRSSRIALDTRESERIMGFRWICRACGHRSALFGGPCRECVGTKWEELSDGKLNKHPERMDIEVHRAGRTFYPHAVKLLNVPSRNLDRLFALSERAHLVAAKWLQLPQVAGRTLPEIAAQSALPDDAPPSSLSDAELDELMKLPPEEMARAIQERMARRQSERQSASPAAIVAALQDQTGVTDEGLWERAETDLLDAVQLRESPTLRRLADETGETACAAHSVARRLGLAEVATISDFPIVSATYAWSRADYAPNLSRLNPFPPSVEHSGRWPIFVDEVRADALWVRLDPRRVARWLELNGFPLGDELGNSGDEARLGAEFVRLLDGAQLSLTLSAEAPQARLVAGLVHTLSHFCLRQAVFHCGLESTSLSEYVLPQALAFAIYCSSNNGATIGALTALFEQGAGAWLGGVANARRCVYDPDCRERGSNCHACTHLAETSCRFFNLNLSRAFLWGGRDAVLGAIEVGYFDARVAAVASGGGS